MFRSRLALLVLLAFAAAASASTPSKLNILVFGAHPDDAELSSGGLGTLLASLGHNVQFCSVTNGDAGHTRQRGPELAARRAAEVAKASAILGTTAKVLDIHDGELEPTLANRRTITRAIRQWNADVVIAHRPNDYHPDHRYVGVLVQDSAFMVAVPLFCPETPALKTNPIFLYSFDRFEKPLPFRPDVVVAIDSVIEKKIDALLTMESQFIEGGATGQYPADAERDQRRAKARENFRKRYATIADKYRDRLLALYGEQGKHIRYAEAFEICEYGRRPSAADLKALFPTVPFAK